VQEFAFTNEVADLPEQHQKNIASGLLRLYGTSNNPRQRNVDPEAEEPEEGQPVPLVDVADANYLGHGALVYNARCAGCHGITGDGNGPAGEHLRPRPRDYRRGIFKFTSTPYGLKPARHDLVRTIRRGAKGTSMPAFPWLADEDLNAVVDYVIYLSERGEVEQNAVLMSDEYEEDEDIDFAEFIDGLDSAAESWAEASEDVVLPASAQPRFSEETVTAGRTLFLSKGCSSCHGVDGKGQVEWLNPEFLAKLESMPEDQRVQINYDAWNEPAPAADLTARMLHGGRRPLDIYRRIHTGINGTPMPAFGDVFAEEPEAIWHLVHYVLHVVDGGDPAAGIESLPIQADEVTESVESESDENTDVEEAATDDAETETEAEEVETEAEPQLQPA